MARERISLKVTRTEHADLVPFLAAARHRVLKDGPRHRRERKDVRAPGFHALARDFPPR